MKSLRAQLISRLVLSGALLLGAAGAALHWQVRRALTAEFDATLRATAQSLATLTEQKQGKVQLELAGENMPQFEDANGAEVFLLRAPDGREIARSRSLGFAAVALYAGSPEAPVFFDTTLADGRAMRCAGLRVTPQEEESGKRSTPGIQVVLTVGRDRAQLDHILARLRAIVLAGAGTALALLAALVHWGVRSGLAPLERLGESVAAVDAASLATRFPLESLPAELRPIAARLNALLARLDGAFERERRFTATAAHELRTPLAELRALAEVNLAAPATDAERAESWRDALAATLRMESLALRLLELARAEEPARIVHREPVVLAHALAAAWRPSAARAAERGVMLDTALPASFTAHTDPALLGVILRNLCANAAEHTPAGTPFRVGAAPAASAVTLLFQNRAGDIAAADIPHLFERFWSKDAARADASHHGLGLGLAAEFAALLGGTLTAQLHAGGDLEFALRLGAPPSSCGTDSVAHKPPGEDGGAPAKKMACWSLAPKAFTHSSP